LRLLLPSRTAAACAFARGSSRAASRAAAAAAAAPARAATQQPLSNAEKKAKRAESQRLGKALVTVQLGKSGVTPSFLQGVADALNAHELVKVRIGGAEADADQVAELVTEAVDAEVVHKIGFTLTLFRDKSLPRLPRIVALAAAGMGGGAGGAEGEDSDEESSSDDEGAPPRPPPPPEFRIVG
jgi:RNA-binding protein